MEDEIILKNQYLKDAMQRSRDVYDTMREVVNEGMNDARDFYFRIALMSGGVVSLSLTYIGYLSSVPQHHVVALWLLIVAWGFLLDAILASVYRNHFHYNMVHWQIQAKYLDAKAEEMQAIIELLEVDPTGIVGIHTREEQQKELERRHKDKGTYLSIKDRSKNKENKYQRIWLWLETASHVGFTVGVLLTVVFAALNLPFSSPQPQPPSHVSEKSDLSTSSAVLRLPSDDHSITPQSTASSTNGGKQ